MTRWRETTATRSARMSDPLTGKGWTRAETGPTTAGRGPVTAGKGPISEEGPIAGPPTRPIGAPHAEAARPRALIRAQRRSVLARGQVDVRPLERHVIGIQPSVGGLEGDARPHRVREPRGIREPAADVDVGEGLAQRDRVVDDRGTAVVERGGAARE